MSELNYTEIVKKASEAVHEIKDQELKKMAFQKILDDLLNNKSQGGGRAKPRSIAREKNSSAKKAEGPASYLEELVGEGFFKKPKSISQAKEELENRGHHIPLTSLSGPLQRLCKRRVLRRQKTKDEEGKRQTFTYSNW